MYCLSIDVSNTYFVLDKKPQGYMPLKGISKENEPTSLKAFKKIC